DTIRTNLDHNLDVVLSDCRLPSKLRQCIGGTLLWMVDPSMDEKDPIVLYARSHFRSSISFLHIWSAYYRLPKGHLIPKLLNVRNSLWRRTAVCQWLWEYIYWLLTIPDNQELDLTQDIPWA